MTAARRRTTRRRGSTRRRTVRRRTVRRRTVRRRTVRRRPRTATTLGSVAALLLLAGFLRLPTGWRIAMIAGLVLLAAGYFLWSRRHEIRAEMQAEMQADRATVGEVTEEEPE